MPGRILPLVTNEIYHVFNRGIDRRPTFTNIGEYKRAIEVISYYRFFNHSMKLSYYLNLAQDRRKEVMNEILLKNERCVDLLAFCLMPNHFHFLIRQVVDNGISKFMSNVQNSYTRYFNTKQDRIGPLFLDQFKAVRIESDEQLLHVSRYIHLNPLTSFVVKNFSSLLEYRWSSLIEYIKVLNSPICETRTILGYFSYNKSKYKNFLEDQVQYQQELHKIKHLLFDE